METYKIEAGVDFVHDARVWRVLAYDANGRCLGADAHWLTEADAVAAKRRYEGGIERHAERSPFRDEGGE